MKKIHFSEQGQALVMITFAIVGLIGMVGLAVDGGIAFSDRRHAQNAADTAAYAGALGKVHPTIVDPDTGEPSPYLTMQHDARARADSNGYFGDLIHSQVEVYTCDEADASCEEPYMGDPDYVQVIITSHVNTFFAHIIGIPQVHNSVQAVALANSEVTGDLYDGAGIVALNPDCPPNGSLIANGSAHINILGGGMLTNSNEACAFKCGITCSDPTKCSLYICNELSEDGTTCIEEGTITSAFADGTSGGFTYAGQCETVQVAENNPGGEDQNPYPPESPDLEVPPQCNPADPANTVYAYTAPWVHDASIAATHITPGYFGTFPPKKDSNGNNLKNYIVMQPGIYCVDTVLKLTGDTVHLYGDDVTIWVRSNNGFTMNGPVVELYANQDPEFEYAGYLIIVEPDYDAAVTACNLEGNADNRFEGAIYAPHCDVTITGTSDTPDDGINSQIIGYNVKLVGNAKLTINYDGDKNPDDRRPSEVGLTR